MKISPRNLDGLLLVVFVYPPSSLSVMHAVHISTENHSGVSEDSPALDSGLESCAWIATALLFSLILIATLVIAFTHIKN